MAEIEIVINVGDRLPDSAVADRGGVLLKNVSDMLGVGGARVLTEGVWVGMANFSPAERLYNPELPADPFYDDDGDPLTSEMRGEIGAAGFLESVGRLLYITEGYGTAAEWEALSFAEKAQWVQDYEAP